jgi:hypothetical protein
MASARKSVQLTDIRFDDERMNRMVQVIRSLEREVTRLSQLLDGGTTGQVLTKRSNEDYDGTWQDP